jgi:hypothetical protein
MVWTDAVALFLGGVAVVLAAWCLGPLVLADAGAAMRRRVALRADARQRAERGEW